MQTHEQRTLQLLISPVWEIMFELRQFLYTCFKIKLIASKDIKIKEVFLD